MAVKLITLTPPAVNMVEGSGPCGICLALKERDESKASTITRTVDNDLRLPLAPNERWMGYFSLSYNGDVGADINVHLAAPPGVTGRWSTLALRSTVTTFVGEVSAVSRSSFGSSSALVLGTAGVTVDVNAMITFVVQNLAPSGSLNLFWAQAVSNATPTIIRANSFIVAHRI